MYNVKNACEECDKVIRCDLRVINNNNKQEVKDRYEINRNKVINTNSRIKKM